MKSLIPKGGDDKIYTPDSLAKRIVKHYNPFGKKCLEPCKGGGAIYLNKIEGQCKFTHWEDYDIL